MRFAHLTRVLALALASAWAAAFSAAQTPSASDAPANEELDVALVLPLEAATYARAADAVRAGFLAAAEAAGSGRRVRVFAHGDDGVLGAFEAAQRARARVIVGPLLRDDLRTVGAMAIDLPTTIALNQYDDVAAQPAALYTFALSIESDARLIARRMREYAPPSPSGAVPNVAVIAADTPLLRRFAGAFASEWQAAGGGLPVTLRLDTAGDGMAATRRELQRRPPAAVLLAVDGTSATIVKPYVGVIPAYASALVFERETMATARDLDGLMVTEIPWIVTPTAPQFRDLPRRDLGSVALTRLYALGLDAFRVAVAFRERAPERFSLDGATGQVTLEGRNFVREGRFAVFRDGNLLPLDGPR